MFLDEILNIPTSKLEFFLRSMEVASYIPGRTRLYTQDLVNNEALKAEITAVLSAYPEIEKVTVNTSTGSLLIEYEPEKLRKNPELRKAELYIKGHAPKRRGG